MIDTRRVPPDWEHPKDERTGQYKPLRDCDYDTAAREWINNLIAWDGGASVLPDGDNVGASREIFRYFWEYAGNPPDKESCRPTWGTVEATCFQLYDKGVPVSPIFESLSSVVDWLVNVQGFARPAVERIAASGLHFGLLINEQDSTA